MDTESEERSSLVRILEYAQILWHWAWLLVLAAVIAGGIAYFISNRQTPIYQSSSMIMIGGATGSTTDSYYSVYIGQQLASTFSQIMLTQPIMDVVSEKIGYPVSAGMINVQQIESSQLIRITVTDTDPQRAAQIANTLVSVFADQVLSDQTSRYADLKQNLQAELADVNAQIDTVNQKLALLNNTTDSYSILQRSQLENSLSQYQQSRAYIVQSYQSIVLAEAQSTAVVIQKDPAVPSESPIQPQPVRSAMLAAVVGLMLAAGTIFLIAFFEDEIRDPEEITRKWGIPVLGLITSYKPNGNGVITMSQPRAPVSEAYRSLRTNLQFSSVDHPIKTLLITSASPSDGKTSVVVNLATVLAQTNKNVVIVDADMRKPRIHKVFSLPNRIGLSDYFIRSSGNISEEIRKTETEGLSIITSGSIPPNPSELLNSSKMIELVEFLASRFDTIILDTPPLLAVTDALVLAPRVDGVIIVMDPVKTKRGAVRHAIEQLKHVNANVIGIVLNNIKVRRSQYYYNRDYYYGKQYGKTEKKAIEVISPKDDKNFQENES